MAINIGKKEIWDFWAPRYEKLWSQYFALGPSRRLIHDHLADIGFKPKDILDLGCGVGQLAHELASQWPEARVVAADYAPGMIERARRDYSAPNVKYILGSLEEIPGKELFDLIVSTNAFPYLPDLPSAAKRLNQLLKPKGRLLLIHANNNNLYDALWLVFVKLTVSKARYPAVPELQQILLNAGFEAGVVRPIRTAFFIPSVNLVEGIKK